MALPRGGDEDFGAHHESFCSPARDEIGALEVPRRSISISAKSAPKRWWENIADLPDAGPRNDTSVRASLMRGAEGVRNWMSRRCCSFMARIPVLALLLFVALLLVVIVLAITLFFLLIQSPSFTELSALPLFSLSPHRWQRLWPRTDESDIANLPTDFLLPPNVASCDTYGFACTHFPLMVIGSFQLCDGVEDCPDGSDEENCKMCQTAFSCTRGNEGAFCHCLRGSKLCDGVRDCVDGSDEEFFCRSNCEQGELSCSDGTTSMCVPAEFRCDGDSHCKGGEDELDCDGKCREGAIWCPITRLCVPKWRVCDGIPDCPDRRDEIGCNCSQCCGSNKALCTNSKVCIDRSRVCDGVVDCPNGDDEQFCPGSCPPVPRSKEILCSDGRLYNPKLACSGLLKECADRCDACDPEVAFTCADHKCVPRHMVCDGLVDCDDGSDESECDCAKLKARGEVMACKERTKAGLVKCIPASQRCDGYADCADGEDEKGCEQCFGGWGAVYCSATQMCLPSTKRCDGFVDCPDGSDEENCTCEECGRQPVPMYKCERAARCFARKLVCDPHTQCPNASIIDRLFCLDRFRSAVDMP